MRFFGDYLRFDEAIARQKGGGTNTTTQQTQTNPRALQAYNLAADTGASVAQQPYPTYPGSLIAGFTPTQQSAFTDINNASGLAQPYIGQAASLINASTSGIDPFAAAAGNMSPYTQQVVDALRANQNLENSQQQSQLEGQAIGAGAYGGDRLAVTQTDLARKQALGNNPAIAAALEHGYDTSLSTGLQQQQANAWLDSQGAFALGNLGNEAQSAALSGAGAKLQAGNQQQTLAQNQLNVPYSQWQAAQAYPFTISNFLSGIASGAAGAGGSSSTTYPGPSGLSQGVGLGTLGLGLYNSGALGSFFGSNYEAGGLPKSGTDPTGGTGWYDPNSSDTGWYNTSARGGRVGLSNGGSIHAHMPHFDVGGAIPGLMNPQTEAMSQLAALSTEKLHELATRFQPGSQQGALVASVLRQRMMSPQGDIGIGGLPGVQQMAGGGGLDWMADEGEELPDFHAPAAADAPAVDAASVVDAPYADSRHAIPVPGLGPVSRRVATREAAMPLPPAQIPPSEDQPAGLTAAPRMRDTGEPLGLGASPSAMDRLTSGPGGALIAAGLGILSGTSPHAAVNIGQGGLQGVNFAQQERLRTAQAALKAEQARWTHEYQMGRNDNAADRNRTYADLSAARASQANAAASLAMARAVGSIGSRASSADLIAGGADELVKSNTIDPSTGDVFTRPNAIRYMNGAAGREQAANRRLDQGDANIDLRRQAAALAKQRMGRDLNRDEQALIERSDSAALRLYIAGKDPITGKQMVTPDQAMATRDQLRAGRPEMPAAAGPRRISSRAEYDGLPVGAAYIAPDGSFRTKQNAAAP